MSLQENCAILKELVSLRAQKASLLGFQTHADYVLEMNMAKTSQTVATFLGSLHPGHRPHFSLLPSMSRWGAHTVSSSLRGRLPSLL